MRLDTLKIELSRAKELFSRYCEKRTSQHNERGLKLFYIIKGEKIVLIESQANCGHPNEWSETPVAQFKYIETTNSWSLFGYNRDLKSLLYVKGHLEKLIQVLDKDLSGVFWTKSEDRN